MNDEYRRLITTLTAIIPLGLVLAMGASSCGDGTNPTRFVEGQCVQSRIDGKRGMVRDAQRGDYYWVRFSVEHTNFGPYAVSHMKGFEIEACE